MGDEENRFSARAARYVRVGTNVGAVAARVAGGRLLGLEHDRSRAAADGHRAGLEFAESYRRILLG